MLADGKLDDCRDCHWQILAALRRPETFAIRAKEDGETEPDARWRARAVLRAVAPYLILATSEDVAADLVERAIENPSAYRVRKVHSTGASEGRLIWTAWAVLRALAPHAAICGPTHAPDKRAQPMESKLTAARAGASFGRQLVRSATITTHALHGLQTRRVEISASVETAELSSIWIEGLTVADGTSGRRLAGLHDRLRRRLRRAIANQRYPEPEGAITISVTPDTDVARLPGLLLPMALAVLAVCDQLDLDGPYAPTDGRVDLRSVVAVGGLDDYGHIRPSRGILPIAIDAQTNGVAALLVGRHVLEEAAAVANLRLLCATTLGGAVDALAELHDSRDDRPTPEPPATPARALPPQIPGVGAGTVADLRAAIGRRSSILIVGPTGSPALQLAEVVHALMPPMTSAERRRTTVIHSVHALHDGPLRTSRPLVRAGPKTPIALLLGRRELVPRQGLVMLADSGVLLVENLGRFVNEQVVAHLLKAVDAGEQHARTADGASRIYPAAAQLVATATPCPCGRASGHGCACPSEELAAYGARLDHYRHAFDLVIELDCTGTPEAT